MQQRTRLFPVSRFIAGGAVLVLAISLVELTNIVSFPLDFLCRGTLSLLSTGALNDLIKTYGYASLFALMTAEGASAPIPSEVILPIAGVLVAQGTFSLPLAFLVSTVAALLGAAMDYYLAFYLGRRFVTFVLRVFRLNPMDLDRAEKWFTRSGQWTVFAARFVPLLRALISLPAGLFRMPKTTFFIATLAGCSIWNAVLLYAGFAAGQYLNSACVGTAGTVVIQGFSAVAATTSAAYLAYFFYVRMNLRAS